MIILLYAFYLKGGCKTILYYAFNVVTLRGMQGEFNLIIMIIIKRLNEFHRRDVADAHKRSHILVFRPVPARTLWSSRLRGRAILKGVHTIVTLKFKVIIFYQFPAHVDSPPRRSGPFSIRTFSVIVKTPATTTNWVPEAIRKICGEPSLKSAAAPGGEPKRTTTLE